MAYKSVHRRTAYFNEEKGVPKKRKKSQKKTPKSIDVAKKNSPRRHSRRWLATEVMIILEVMFEATFARILATMANSGAAKEAP